MKFHVPGDHADHEAELARLAMMFNLPVPPVEERLESLTYTHNGETWTATVGEQLRGERVDRRRRKGGPVDVTTRLYDDATVLAIFAGQPITFVVTDARPVTEVVSVWENSFMVNELDIRTGRRFDTPETTE